MIEKREHLPLTQRSLCGTASLLDCESPGSGVLHTQSRPFHDQDPWHFPKSPHAWSLRFPSETRGRRIIFPIQQTKKPQPEKSAGTCSRSLKSLSKLCCFFWYNFFSWNHIYILDNRAAANYMVGMKSKKEKKHIKERDHILPFPVPLPHPADIPAEKTEPGSFCSGIQWLWGHIPALPLPRYEKSLPSSQRQFSHPKNGKSKLHLSGMVRGFNRTI